VSAIAFDFHNTLFTCDAWFQLEVHEIMVAFLRWHADGGDFSSTDALEQRARAAYRSLRQEIQRHGQEQDAISCIRSVLASLSITIQDSHIETGVHEIMGALPVAQPMPGVRETVESLRLAGIPMAIISSAIYEPFIRRSLAAHRLEEYFDDVTTSAGCGFYKTRPEIFWHATAMLGAKPHETAHVGDSARFDIAGAKRAGLRTAWVSYGRALDHSDERPDLVLPNLQNAAGALLGLVDGITAPSRP
jgi:FMN phosphatase YigB (HAD superfamily)